MITALLAVAAAASPLDSEALIKLGIGIAIALWMISLADGSGDIEQARDEIEALPLVTRREALRILDARRWR